MSRCADSCADRLGAEHVEDLPLSYGANEANGANRANGACQQEANGREVTSDMSVEHLDVRRHRAGWSHLYERGN